MFVLFSVDFSKYMPQCKKAVFSRYFVLDDKLYRTAHKNAVTVSFWGKFGIYSNVGTKKKTGAEQNPHPFSCGLEFYILADYSLNNAVNLGTKVVNRFV